MGTDSAKFHGSILAFMHGTIVVRSPVGERRSSDDVIGASHRAPGGAWDPEGMAGVQASVVNPLVRLAFRLVINTPDLGLLARQYVAAEPQRDPDASPLYADANPAQVAIHPGAPHEFLNLRDRISAASDARRRRLECIDGILRD
jgi:hypothetical protein